MIYRCPGCAGALIYNPEKKGMTCKYCDQIFDVSKLKEEKEKDSARRDSFDVNIFSCTSCGAELMVNETEASTFCAYCGQPTVIFSRVSNELRPDLCIPFSVTGEEAVEFIQKKFNNGLFIPSKLRNVKLDNLRGIYVPFWLNDVKIHEMANVTATTGHGKDEKSYSFFRDAETTYSKITTDASQQLSDELTLRLEPYDFKALKTFRPKYLSGFYADCFDLTEASAKETALRRANEFIEADILQSVGGYERKEITGKAYRSEILKTSYALLPAWFMTFKYHRKIYTILVNGQTGKVVGNIPMNKQKIILSSIPLAVGLSVALSLLNGVFIALSMAFDSDIPLTIPVLIWYAILNFFKRTSQELQDYRRKRKDFMSSNTISYIKERQENEWKP